MKEAPTKNLPPKNYIGTVNGGTPIKNNSNNNFNRTATSDEILSTLLRINNFDSISSIKDESLDIDLSACVTISSDPSGMINGNSLSSHDFWRVLDESAQNPGQLESNDFGGVSGSVGNVSNFLDCSVESKNEDNNLPFLAKPESHSSFSGTFLRPEPPSLLSISPLKKFTKALPAEHIEKQHRKPKKTTTVGAMDQRLTERKKPKTLLTPSLLVKQEPPEQLLADDDVGNNRNNHSDKRDIVDIDALISKQNFNLLIPPTTGSKSSIIISSNVNKKCHSAINLKTEAPIKLVGNSVSINTSSGNCVTNHILGGNEDIPQPPPPESLFKCEDCGGLVLQGQKAYAMHEALSHKILFKCNECEKDFDNENSLKKHVKTHRTVESRKDAWKKCPDCGKCLKLGSMWMHRKIHSDNKKYGCDICGQKFVQKINLTHHSRVHTSEKPYECPECQKRFQERSHLQRHQKYHAQTRSYRCEKCGKMYKTERCLKVHNLVHLEQRPFACSVCDKSFISNSKLKQHSNIHTGERPFKCNYCPRDFTNFPNWLKHTRRRHKVDHKTGEHLENIPSYCSKKSTKSTNTKVDKTQPPPKSQMTSTEAIIKTSTTLDAVNSQVTVTTTVAKPQAKRKKKPALPPIEQMSTVAQDITANNEATTATNTTVLQSNEKNTNSQLSGSKVVKLKRERKQTTPKQVQKQLAPAAVIKKEIVDCLELPIDEDQTAPSTTASVSTNFPDLHCLSITSAEELIMEQALEMEECGLYDAPATVLDTDNAVSAESVAALRFKIKNEFMDIKEEYDTAVNNRVLCSSLESSPFSSPTSIEFSNSSIVSSASVSFTTIANTARSVNQSSIDTTAASFYLPSFRLNEDTIVNKNNLNPNTNTSTSTTSTTTLSNGFSTQALLQSIQQQMPTPAQQEQQTSSLPSAQALLNHLYVPISMSMPLLMQPQLCTTTQVLPSVDTLLFTHSNANFFRGKSAAQATAHHNM